MIAVSYRRQLLPGSFEHALSCLIDNAIDLGRFATRFKNDEADAPAYVVDALLATANKHAPFSTPFSAQVLEDPWSSNPPLEW